MSIRKTLEAARANLLREPDKAHERRDRMIAFENKFKSELAGKVVSKDLLSKTYSL